MKWTKVSKRLPEPLYPSQKDITVAVRMIEHSMMGDECERYAFLIYRLALKGFIEWGYNAKGEFDAFTYNTEQSNPYSYVTHWRFVKGIKGDIL